MSTDTSTARTRTADRLELLCHACQRPVTDGAGYVHLPIAEEKRATREHAALQAADRAREATEGTWHAVDLAGWMRWEPARWQIHHGGCDPVSGAGDYWFAVERARTVAHLLDWTLHLTEKDWLQVTDWTDFVRALLRVNRADVDA